VFEPTVRYALELLSWAAMGATAFYFFAFALAYTGRGSLLDGLRRPLVAVPAVIGVAGVTNPVHGLLWVDFGLEPVAGMATVSYNLFPWATVGATAGILLVSVGSLLLFDTVVSYGPLYRSEAVAVGLSTIPPVVAMLVWLYGLGPVPELNLATTMFLPHVALDGYAFLRTDMFEFHPATRRAGERAAIDDVGAPVVIVDERGRIATLNEAAESAFDSAKSAALTNPIDDLVGESVDPAEGNDTVTVHRGHERTVYSVSATPLADAAGRHVGHTVIFQDVTAERRREQRLGVLNRVLRHNLRNDLTVVRGFVEAARTRVADDEAASMLRRATDTADELATLGEKARDIERILDREGTVERVDVEALLADSIDGLETECPETTVRNTADAVAVTTDPAVLGVIVDALLENALEYGEAVELSASRCDGQVRITVTDDGPGIPDHEVSVLSAGDETALEHGSGLGLWLVRWGTRTLGADLDFDVDGTGTTATITLPERDTPAGPSGA
jgi:signal transduction histidine kinase